MRLLYITHFFLDKGTNNNNAGMPFNWYQLNDTEKGSLK